MYIQPDTHFIKIFPSLPIQIESGRKPAFRTEKSSTPADFWCIKTGGGESNEMDRSLR
jgi:hypothetical protein